MQIVRFTLAIAVLGLAIGCSKSENQNAEAVKGANKAFADLQSATEKANKMGAPTAAWSDENLAVYGELMSRIDVAADRAQSFDGKGGIAIHPSDRLVEAKEGAKAGRELVTKILDQKHRLKLIQGLQKDIPVLRELPNPSWSSEKIAQLERVVDHAESSAKQLDFLALHEPELILASEISKLVEIQRNEIAKVKNRK